MPSNLSSASHSRLNHLDLYTIFSEPPWGNLLVGPFTYSLLYMFFFLSQISLCPPYHIFDKT